MLILPSPPSPAPQELWASFRGRRMGGRELPLPHGYQGVLLREDEPPPGHRGDPQVRLPHTWGQVRSPLWGRAPHIAPLIPSLCGRLCPLPLPPPLTSDL